MFGQIPKLVYSNRAANACLDDDALDLDIIG
jgi:hypothetical protein